jgi:diaminobutyrate-2-oxoglutarate transaminase
MAAGSATLRVIQEENLLSNVRLVGDFLLSALLNFQSSHNFIGDVRGRGLMVAIEIVDINARPDSRGSYPTFFKLARAIQFECFRRGLIIELGGRDDSTVRLLPPLNITLDQASQVITILGEALRHCAGVNHSAE